MEVHKIKLSGQVTTEGWKWPGVAALFLAEYTSVLLEGMSPKEWKEFHPQGTAGQEPACCVLAVGLGLRYSRNPSGVVFLLWLKHVNTVYSLTLALVRNKTCCHEQLAVSLFSLFHAYKAEGCNLGFLAHLQGSLPCCGKSASSI